MPITESSVPLGQVHALESTGLGVAAETKHLMGSIETKVVSPLRGLSERILIMTDTVNTLLTGLCDASDPECDKALNASVDRLAEYAATECTSMATLIGRHSARAIDIGLRMDQFAADVHTFGRELKIQWAPKFKKHRDGKASTHAVPPPTLVVVSAHRPTLSRSLRPSRSSACDIGARRHRGGAGVSRVHSGPSLPTP